jgi:DNA-binding MarR family transcriptional regulator
MSFYQSPGFLFFGTRLKRLSEAFLNDVNKLYRKHKISFDASWFPVFYLLAEHGEVSIRAISNELRISHSAASQMVSSLQQKGYIKSTVSKKDARHKVVAFTAKGQKLLQKVQPVWTALQQAMEELSTETTPGKKILDALTALENNLQKKSVYERVDNKMK